MTHVRTAPHYPQSNGKIERWHKTLKTDAIRVEMLADLDEARRVIAAFAEHYNSVRLHSAIGYIAPRIASPDGLQRSGRRATTSSKPHANSAGCDAKALVPRSQRDPRRRAHR
jgi:transposase InsO family protein